MSAVTIPVPTLVAMTLGILLAVAVVARSLRWRAAAARGASADQRRDPRGDEEATMVPLGDVARAPSASAALLLLINAAYPILLIALPSTPIFGGTKHWLNALPFLCVLGAWAICEGLARLARALARPQLTIAFAALLALVVAPGFLLSARVHPYGLSAYNEIVGFARGAANIGFQRTVWGYEPRLALPFINERAPKGGRVHFGDTNLDDYRAYQKDGLLRRELRWAGTVAGADIASVQPQGEFKDQWMDVLNEWDVLGPDEVVHIEGVPLLTVTLEPGER
jgi:hypothetical protein